MRALPRLRSLSGGGARCLLPGPSRWVCGARPEQRRGPVRRRARGGLQSWGAFLEAALNETLEGQKAQFSDVQHNAQARSPARKRVQTVFSVGLEATQSTVPRRAPDRASGRGGHGSPRTACRAKPGRQFPSPSDHEADPGRHHRLRPRRLARRGLLLCFPSLPARWAPCRAASSEGVETTISCRARSLTWEMRRK